MYKFRGIGTRIKCKLTDETKQISYKPNTNFQTGRGSLKDPVRLSEGSYWTAGLLKPLEGRGLRTADLEDPMRTNRSEIYRIIFKLPAGGAPEPTFESFSRNSNGCRLLIGTNLKDLKSSDPAVNPQSSAAF